MSKDKVESMRFNKGMKVAATDLEGASGGLLVLWKDNLEVDIIVNEGNILFIYFKNVKAQLSYFLMNIYAPNSKNGRKVFWGRLCNLFSNLKGSQGYYHGRFQHPP